MRYALSAHLTFCVASNRVVFLDQRRDRYFCLGREAEEAFFCLMRHEAPQHHQLQELERLVAEDILVPDVANGVVSACTMELPSSSLYGSARRPILLPELAGLVTSILATAIRLRFQPLAAVLAEIKARKGVRICRRARPDMGAAAATADALRRINLMLDAQDKCLARSVAVMTHLLRRGVRPDLVFAVMVRPFSAHCWVQLDGVVLTDEIDAVRGFTPILVI